MKNEKLLKKILFFYLLINVFLMCVFDTRAMATEQIVTKISETQFTEEGDKAEEKEERKKYAYSKQYYETKQKKLNLKEEPFYWTDASTVIGRVVVPDDWLVETEYLMIDTESITCPNAVVVRVSNPEHDCELLYISRREFKQSLSINNGIESISEDDYYDAENFWHFLNYRDAWESCNYIAQSEYGISEDGVDIPFIEEEQLAINQTIDSYTTVVSNLLQNAMKEGIVIENYMDAQCSFVERYYKGKDYNVIICSGSTSYELYWDENGIISDEIIWAMPAVYAIKSSSIEEYRELFDVFRAVTGVSQEYMQMRSMNAQEFIGEFYNSQSKNIGVYLKAGVVDNVIAESISTSNTFAPVEEWDSYVQSGNEYTTGRPHPIKVLPNYNAVFEVGNDGLPVVNENQQLTGGIVLIPSTVLNNREEFS